MGPLLDRARPHWGPSPSSLDRPSTSHARARPQLAGVSAGPAGSRLSFDRASTNLVDARRSLDSASTSRDRVLPSNARARPCLEDGSLTLASEPTLLNLSCPHVIPP